ncbi:MAG: Na+(H+)/acetate symporter ActP [Planctomycetota bacterium]|jgi:Na+(H+)/acetate symporter ActP
MILSLYWSGLTARGAKFAMVAGFLAVLFFKFGAPALLPAIGLEAWVARLADLDVLLPSFVVGFFVAIVVSMLDKEGRARLEGITEELQEARS